MPKQDKGGGIFPTAESARFCPWKRCGGAAFAVPPHSVSRLSLAYNTRETRVWGKGKSGKEFGATPCNQTINML